MNPHRLPRFRLLFSLMSATLANLAARAETSPPPMVVYAEGFEKEPMGTGGTRRSGDCQIEYDLHTFRIGEPPPTVNPPGPAPAGQKKENTSVPPRPKPKPRPQMGQPMVDTTGKLHPAMPILQPPELHERDVFMQQFASRICDEWDNAMRKESADWHPAADVHFVFSVEPEKGTVNIESQSSPSNSTRLERFGKLLESLSPVTLPASLRATCAGQPLRFDFSYKAVKDAPAGT